MVETVVQEYRVTLHSLRERQEWMTEAVRTDLRSGLLTSRDEPIRPM